MRWLHFILSHSIFIATCSVAMVFQTSQLLHHNINPFVYGFVFFATLCSYNFYWILSKLAFVPGKVRADLLKREMTGVLLLLISAAGLLYCLYRTALPSFLIVTAGLLTIIYAMPLLPFRVLHFTRKAGVLKTILLAFTWAYVTVLIPIQKSYDALSRADLFVFSRRFLFMLMLCIIFDNRDKHVDKIRGLHSLATDLRPAVLTGLIYIIFAALFVSNFLYAGHGITFYQSMALQVSTIALLIVYFFSAKERGYLFYYFLVDGLMLFSALATFIAGI